LWWVVWVGGLCAGWGKRGVSDLRRQVNAGRATSDLFTTLGVPPLLGRTFDDAETRPGGAPVAVLSQEVWRSAFGGNPSIVGQPVEIDGRPRTVVGIMPPRFDVADQHAEIWLPLVLDPANRSNRRNHYLY